MSLSIKIKGNKNLQKAIKKTARKAPKKIDSLLAKAAFGTHNIAIKSIQQGQKTGRTYRRRSISHKASAPGEAPATDTGNLVQNITVKREGFMHYTVGSRKDAGYGFFLEFGTHNMAARPWLTPAARQGRKQLRKDIRRIK